MSVVSPSFRARVRSSIEEPVAAFFGRLGFSPNALTVIGFGIAAIGAYFAAVQSWLIAGLIVAFGAVFDLFDGALARATGRTSRFGAFLDSTFDRAGEAVVYVGIAAGALVGGFEVGVLLAMAALTAAFLVSYTRAKSESLGFDSGKGIGNVGVAPREIRTVILVVGLLLLAFAGPIGPWVLADCPADQLVSCLPPDYYRVGDLVLGASLGLITVLATVTTLQRIYFVYRQSK